MSRWADDFSNHPIHSTLRELRECASTEFKEVSEDLVVERRRFLKILSSIEDVLGQLDPELAPQEHIDSLQGQLTQPNVKNQLANYKSKGDVGNLRTANDHLSNGLNVLAVLQSSAVLASGQLPKVEADIEGVVDHFAHAVVAKKKQLEQQLAEVTGGINSK